MKIKLPTPVEQIILTLQRNGFEALIVGGCVRDSLMGKQPNDWDVCTSALPQETMKCFEGFRIVETGLIHGTVSIIIDNEAYEVTTYRVDGEYYDNRHPEQVKFVTSLNEDLARRDFTINSMAYSYNTGIIDYYSGENDLRQGLIRCVGNSEQRFREDALRIMRALRFASVFSFRIEEQTALNIYTCKESLKNISQERLNTELCKLILGKGAEAVLTQYVDIIAVIIPEIKPMVGFNQHNPYHHLDVWNHTVQSVVNAPEDLIIRLTMLFHDIAKPNCCTMDENGQGHFYGHPKCGAQMAFNIMKRLKFSNEILFAVRDLITYHGDDLQPSNKLIKRLLNKIGEVKLRQLLQVKRADTMAQPKKICDERLKLLAKVEQCVDDVTAQRQCFCLKDLDVNGRDLIAIGIPEGREIGTTLDNLMELVIDEQVENERGKLLEVLKSLTKPLDFRQ